MPQAATMQKPTGQSLFLWGALLLSAGLIGFVLLATRQPDPHQTALAPSRFTLAEIPFDGEQAYDMLEQLCALGPRYSGSPGMQAQQELLHEYFTGLGATVEMQRFRDRHPLTGEEVPMANMIVHWHPERTERILLCAHYDTRPFPDRDPDPARRRGTFLGANDGASGVAVLAELGRHMADLDSNYGVDFVLFDAEEFCFDEDTPLEEYFKGSNFFASSYANNPPPYRYHKGVLLDMVGDAHLDIRQEQNSMGFRDARPIVVEIWHTAQDLGVTEFISRRGHRVSDDHLPLNNIAGIPTIDIIDFDYGPPGTRINYWHTEADVPENCSALSLAKVGWVLHEWLQNTE